MHIDGVVAFVFKPDPIAFSDRWQITSPASVAVYVDDLRARLEVGVGGNVGRPFEDEGSHLLGQVRAYRLLVLRAR